MYLIADFYRYQKKLEIVDDALLEGTHRITVFPLTRGPDAYLFSKFEGVALAGLLRLFESNKNYMKFQNFVIVSFEITINNYYDILSLIMYFCYISYFYCLIVSGLVPYALTFSYG